MASGGQKTEKPTPKRIEKARKEGRFAVSKEVLQAAQFLALTALLNWWAQDWIARWAAVTKACMRLSFHAHESTRAVLIYASRLILPELGLTVLAGFTLTLAALSAQMAMTKFGLANARIAPEFSRLNPLSRLAGLLPQNMAELAKALVLLPLFVALIWMIVRSNLKGFLALPWMPVRLGTTMVGASIRRLLWYAWAAYLVTGLIDWAWQKYRLTESLRMSKQEIREEQKESEGNPETKNRVRRMQREMARTNMMKDVGRATAVIVNPTHFAVAIHYQMESSSAPKVVAKGQNYLALRIRERALDCGIPIVENKPLAQALYHSVEVGQEIPAHLYRAVAEILAYIYKLMQGRLPG
jgi:flagellar biosynthesis protein FlhB